MIMPHCIEYFEKWRKEPNFCGIGKVSANQIDQYLKFVDEFAGEYDIDVAVIYRNCPSTAIKPLLRFKKDSEIRIKAKKEIAEVLKNKQGITSKFINVVIGLPPIPIKMKEEPRVIVAPMSEPHREVVSKNTIKDKIRLITSPCTLR